MKLIVGLGNPGKKYVNTRHNLGFMVVDELAKKWKLKWRTDKKTETLRALKTSENTEIVLAKPLTFMNSSGLAVKKLVNFNKLNNFNNLYIIHDDVDLELGKIKVVQGRGAAGHHGVESIIQHLGSKGFYRVRLGIGRSGILSIRDRGVLSIPDRLFRIGRTSFVLSPFTLQEKPIVQKMIKEGIKILVGAVGMAGSAPAASASRTQHSN